ncbi:MAG: hypothetical protein ACM30G_02605 [Micromonosporaceae bacterium]
MTHGTGVEAKDNQVTAPVPTPSDPLTAAPPTVRRADVRDPRYLMLRNFAISMSVFNVLGYTVLGFEQPWTWPIFALLVAYAIKIAIGLITARASQRPPAGQIVVPSPNVTPGYAGAPPAAERGPRTAAGVVGPVGGQGGGPDPDPGRGRSKPERAPSDPAGRVGALGRQNARGRAGRRLMETWARVVGFVTTASSRPDRWSGRAGGGPTVPAFGRRGAELETADTVEHTGADESQRTIDWLAELRAATHGPAPAWKSEPDPDVGRMAYAIDEAVRAFRTRLDEAVRELCGHRPEMDRAPAGHRRLTRGARRTASGR